MSLGRTSSALHSSDETIRTWYGQFCMSSLILWTVSRVIFKHLDFLIISLQPIVLSMANGITSLSYITTMIVLWGNLKLLVFHIFSRPWYTHKVYCSETHEAIGDVNYYATQVKLKIMYTKQCVSTKTSSPAPWKIYIQYFSFSVHPQKHSALLCYTFYSVNTHPKVLNSNKGLLVWKNINSRSLYQTHTYFLSKKTTTATTT